MKNRLVALIGAVVLLLTLSGCGVFKETPQYGTVQRKSGNLQAYQVFVRTPDGVDHTIKVTKAQHRDAREGHCWSVSQRKPVPQTRCDEQKWEE